MTSNLKADLARSNAQTSQERALLDYAEQICRSRQAGIAIHVQLSRLESYNRMDNHIKAAANAFQHLIKQFDGIIFTLMNKDIVFTCKNAQIEDIEPVVRKLRHLFSDDSASSGLCTWHMLGSDARSFLAMARRFFEISEAQHQEMQRLRKISARRQLREPLTPASLAKLEVMLATIDLGTMLRNQPVCLITRSDPPEPVMDEVYVSMAELEEKLIPDMALTTDPWLFRHLTQVLDRRMLAQVLHTHPPGSRVFSLNLNIATILSAEFQRFDRELGLGMRGRLVIEVQKADVIHDMGAFIFAREYLHARGYKVCLDGLTHLLLPYVDSQRLDIDLMKMHWSPELMGGVTPGVLKELEGYIRAAGRGRVILCRCDSEDSIQVGQALGISLFQGRHVDQLLLKAANPLATARSQGQRAA